MPRAALASVLLIALLLGVGSSAPAQASTPVITLLTPKNGAKLAIPAWKTDQTKFSWQINWDVPDGATVAWEIAPDPSFSINVTGENRNCPASNINCFSSFAPPRAYGPPYPNVFYWRVRLYASSGTFTSAISKYSVVNLADHVKPRVRISKTFARRGARAYVMVRAADNRGRVRLHVTIQYHGHAYYNARMPMTTTYWADPLFFETRTPLPRSLPRGRYLACAKAWDEARNHARACAPLRVR